MANFLLARAETGARGKVFLWGEAREKRAIFVARIDYLYLKRSTEYVIPHTVIVTQNNSPQGRRAGASSVRADVLHWYSK